VDSTLLSLACVDNTQLFRVIVDSILFSPVIVFLHVHQSATSSLYVGVN
jgi:hypothetical protein